MGAPRFNFGETLPMNQDYTPRQMAILNEEIPLEQVRPNELGIIIRKATERGDEEQAETAKNLQWKKQNPRAYSPSCTFEEAKQILQRLTPWDIKWSTGNP